MVLTYVIFTLHYKVTMRLSSMVVLVLMIQTCIESLAIILPFIYPDCITGLTSSQTDRDRLVDFSPLSSPLYPVQILQISFISSDEDAGFVN